MSIYEVLTDISEYEKLQKIVDNYRAKFYKSNNYVLPTLQVLKVYRQRKCANESCRITISLPVCNQEKIISEVLKSVLRNTEIASNLVLILDACHDNSEVRVINAIESLFGSSNVQRIILLKSNGDLFESTCENIAFELMKSEYFLSLQADIILHDNTFLSRAIIAFEKYSDLLGLSGRAIIPASNRKKKFLNRTFSILFSVVNNLFSKISKVKKLSPFYSNSNYFGDLSAPPNNKMMFSRKQLSKVYIGDSIIRGPILWRSKYLKELGLFRDDKYFLGGDERDISIKGFNQFGYKVGYLPTSCFSYLWTGTSHNPQLRTEETLNSLNSRKRLQKQRGGNFLFELDMNSDFIARNGLTYPL